MYVFHTYIQYIYPLLVQLGIRCIRTGYTMVWLGMSARASSHWFISKEAWIGAFIKRKCWRKSSLTTFCSAINRWVYRFISENCLQKRAIWSLNKTLHKIILRMNVRTSWKNTSLLIRQHSGALKIVIHCFLGQSGTIFGALSPFYRFILKMFITTLGLLIFQEWCDGF